MPTQEERLLALEQGHKDVVEAVKDINHYVTMMYGVIGQQGVDIRDIKIGMRSSIERITALDECIAALDMRFTSLDPRFTSLEQNVNSRFEAQDKKLDQILFVLSTLIEKSRS